jgi:glycyl-tRNA synthetase beta chain
MSTDALLAEIGTEELPPTSLRALAEALNEEFTTRLDVQHIAHGASRWFATPRRLAVLVDAVASRQGDTQNEKLGPAVSAAFDSEGRPTSAAAGFARSCGVEVAELERTVTERGERLVFRQTIPGQPMVNLVPAILEEALAALPIAKRMRWGARRAEFVRPVHWIVLLYGSTVIPGSVLGIRAGRETRGHRVHGLQRISLECAGDFEDALREQGSVIVDYGKRRRLVAEQVRTQAAALGGHAVIDEDLLEEVTSLVEWPRALTGRFESRFLSVPAEALISSMKQHQKYFHARDGDGKLMPHFITVANIESSDPQKVVHGNERVIRPRLADAAFFFEQDKQVSLEARRERLRSIVFQTDLGSVWDKTERVAALAGVIGASLGADAALCERAGRLSKADLVSEMVQEFDELQGTMGYYYAINDGESTELAEAMREQYLPRHAGDRLPASAVGTALAIADRLDTLVGIFGIGQQPTGSRDPFGLRRAALGVLRTVVENRLDLDLRPLTARAAAAFPALARADSVVATVLDYMLERFRAWYADEGIAAENFLAVHARGITRPLDFDARVRAVSEFRRLPQAAALAAANKRVANILTKQADGGLERPVDPVLLEEEAERRLAEVLEAKRSEIAPLLARSNYTEALRVLAALREPVDAFFDHVLVMTDRQDLRENRLALLTSLRNTFLEVADISLLAVGA